MSATTSLACYRHGPRPPAAGAVVALAPGPGDPAVAARMTPPSSADGDPLPPASRPALGFRLRQSTFPSEARLGNLGSSQTLSPRRPWRGPSCQASTPAVSRHTCNWSATCDRSADARESSADAANLLDERLDLRKRPVLGCARCGMHQEENDNAITAHEPLFLPQRFHRIDPGGSTRRDPRREQARDNNHQQAGEICDGIGDVHDRSNHRAGFGCEHECRQ